MKIVKARKEHRCSECNKGIKKGEIYGKKRLVYKNEVTEDVFGWDSKKCHKCMRDFVKNTYKMASSIIRAAKRKKNCPDEKFENQWNGGWCNGSPDGGDVSLVCNNCNLSCTK